MISRPTSWPQSYAPAYSARHSFGLLPRNNSLSVSGVTTWAVREPVPSAAVSRLLCFIRLPETALAAVTKINDLHVAALFPKGQNIGWHDEAPCAWHSSARGAARKIHELLSAASIRSNSRCAA